MTEIISIINQKGGVGKTTAALQLAAGLRRRKKQVLNIDLDPQANMSFTMHARLDALNSMDLLTGKATASDTIQHAEQGDIIAAGAALAAVDRVQDAGCLARALQPVKDAYDYIVIDTPPALNMLTLNALTAATSIIITTKADVYSLQGIAQLEQTIEATRHHTNPNLAIDGILIAYHKPHAVLVKTMMESLRQMADRLDTRLYKTAIRDCIALQEAEISKQDIFTYAPRSNAAADYAAFVKEFISRRK